MNILTIGFKGATFFEEHIKGEAESRGHKVDFCSASELSIDVRADGVDIRAGELDLTEYDLVHVGAIGSNRWTVIAALGYLYRNANCKVVDARLVESTLDEYSGLSKYFLEQEEGLYFPRSISFKRPAEIESRFGEFEMPAIIKTNSSKQGAGVGKVGNFQELKAFVAERLKIDPKSGFILRERIPNDGDYRVNVIDGEAIMCLKRTPKKGEFRSNIALGGELTDAGLVGNEEICEAAEKIVRLSNYDIAGVDVMVHKETGKPYILEVNRAPSGLEDDQEVSGMNLAKLIVDLYEKRVSGTVGMFATVVEYFGTKK